MVVSYKAATAVEHFLVARYFMYKTVALHKTVFAFEALVRHILFLLRQKGEIYADGRAIEQMVRTDEFLDFNDAYVDKKVEEFSKRKTLQNIVFLCKALNKRKPPKLIHEVAVLSDRNHPTDPAYAVFTNDRAGKINTLKKKYDIEPWRVIWKDPKDLHFEGLGPFVQLSAASGVTPEETAELVRIKMRDGTIGNLVEDKTSIVYHLSRLKFQMSRVYVVGQLTKAKLQKIQKEVQAWSKHG
jgi:HD superfamily phosphohydrolase